jgi:hypothetical protein
MYTWNSEMDNLLLIIIVKAKVVSAGPFAGVVLSSHLGEHLLGKNGECPSLP